MTVFRRVASRNPSLLGLFVISFAWIAWFATKVHAPSLMPDEIRTVEQAVSIAAHFWSLSSGDAEFQTYSQLQPTLMAPLWGLFETPRAYQLTHVLNALLLASSVFPAYLLTLRVVHRRAWALIAAALIVLVPWTLMTGAMVSESSAYPLAIWAYYGLLRAVTGRGPREDLIAIAFLALAYGARTQLIVLAPILPLAIAAQGLRYPEAHVDRPTRRVRALVRRHWLAFSVSAVGLVLFLVTPHTIIGDAPDVVLPSGWGFTARQLLSSVAVGVAVLPLTLAAGWAAGTLWRPRTPDQHAFAIIGALAAILMTCIVGGGSRQFTPDIDDRYLAYLAPLLLIGMIACLLEARAWRGWLVVAGVGAAWIVKDAALTEAAPTLRAPAAAWYAVLQGHAPEIGRWFGAVWNAADLMAWWTLFSCAAIVLARTWLRPALVATIVVVLVGGYAFAETTYTRHKIEALQPPAGFGAGRNWVDRTLPYGTQADAILSTLASDPASATAAWWDLTFWNAQITGTKVLQPSPTAWSEQAFPQPFTIDPQTGAIAGAGEHGYVVQGLADRRFAFRGALPVGAPQHGFQILQVAQPAYALWTWAGPDEAGYLPPGGTATVRVFADGLAGRRGVALALENPAGVKRASRYRVSSAGGRTVTGRVAVGQQALPTIELDLPATGHVDLALTAPDRAQGVQFTAAGIGPVDAGA